MIKARLNSALRNGLGRTILQSNALKIAGLLLPVLLAGCGGGSFTGSKTAPTVTISSSPASVAAGGSSTLTIAATNATTVMVAGSDGSSYSMASTGGTKSVTPAATTTYTATASGTGGTVTATAVVTVTAVVTPTPTVTIAAAPASVVAGSTSTLTVVATNATTVTIAGSDNSSYTLATTGGTQAVSPTATTTYTATAKGAGGTVTAKTTVTVTPATGTSATVTISASPTSITSGSSSTLTVSATNATAVVVTGSDNTSYTLFGTGGIQAVTPTATTTYTATATGAGGQATAMTTVTVSANPNPTVTITANPSTITTGSSSTLTVTAAYATGVVITGDDNSSYTLSATGGTQVVSPTAATTNYTATATGATGTTPSTATVMVTVKPAGSVAQVNHVILMLQENHSFDNYFGMLNPYREGKTSANTEAWNIGDDGVEYDVDGIDDKLSTTLQDDQGDNYSLFKLKSTCVDDMSSDWLSSFGDVNRYDFLANRKIPQNGFVHNAEGFANSCVANGATCSGTFSDLTGQRAMGYYDQGFLNYYYYMASQYAISDRWFSPVASKSIDNRIATFSGGTTQGLTRDPGGNDHLPQLALPSIFQALSTANVSWKIYYTVTAGFCTDEDDCPPGSSASDEYPATDFENFTYSFNYLRKITSTYTQCTGNLQPSGTAVNDPTNSFCIDITHIAPLTQYYTDLQNGTLPSFAFIEAGYAHNDEHPGSGQTVLHGQTQVAAVIGAFTKSSSYADSVFFFSYDEGGGPYDHVPPVPTHSNDYTDAMVGAAVTATDYPDVSTIAVNPDPVPNQTGQTNPYFPCVNPETTPASLHCDLGASDPGANAGDAAAISGFGAQIGFRLPNFVISPFSRRHYVSHIPMDHTAVMKFVEDRFIGNGKYLTQRDAAQPNLLDFFDFTNIPWATPPTPPTPYTDPGPTSCTPTTMGP